VTPDVDLKDLRDETSLGLHELNCRMIVILLDDQWKGGPLSDFSIRAVAIRTTAARRKAPQRSAPLFAPTNRRTALVEGVGR